MPDQSDEFRKRASDCLAAARTAEDPATRANLLIVAQRWFDLANGPSINFEALQRDFNDRQMRDPPQPPLQQQQQIHPDKTEP